MLASHKQILKWGLNVLLGKLSAINWEGHQKFCQKSKSMPTKSWKTFACYCVPQLTADSAFCKNSNICFFCEL